MEKKNNLSQKEYFMKNNKKSKYLTSKKEKSRSVVDKKYYAKFFGVKKQIGIQKFKEKRKSSKNDYK